MEQIPHRPDPTVIAADCAAETAREVVQAAVRIATLITSSTLIDRQAEVVRDVADRVARQEPVDELLDARATLGEEGKAECDVRVDDHVRAAVDRQLDLRSPAVVAVGGPLQVVADESSESCFCPVRTSTSSSRSASLRSFAKS